MENRFYYRGQYSFDDDFSRREMDFYLMEGLQFFVNMCNIEVWLVMLRLCYYSNKGCNIYNIYIT